MGIESWLQIDPITLEVIRNSLESTVEEMGITVQKLAHSPIFSESKDFSVAVFDAEAQLVALAQYTPGHQGGMQSAIERDLRLFRRGHTFDDVARTVHLARSAGLDNLNLDLIYWRNEPYLGFGCGAHSWFAGRRFSNLRHPRAYVAAIEAGQTGEAEAEVISRELEMGETMMVGLRLLEEGVTFERFASRFGADVRDVYRGEIERLLKIGLIEADTERVRLSRRGRLVGNRVFGEFLPAFGFHRQ